MQSDRQLKFWYDRYNKLYWDGKLPQHTIVYWEPPPGAFGNTCPVYEVDHGQFVIKLDPALKGVPDYWKIMLGHEMIHVSLWTLHPKHQHGKLFVAEKDRIYALGFMKRLW